MEQITVTDNSRKERVCVYSRIVERLNDLFVVDADVELSHDEVTGTDNCNQLPEDRGQQLK